MSKENHIEKLCQWLENGLLPKLSGNEAFVLKNDIAEARKAAQQSVQRTANGACENCGNNCWKLVCETCGAE